jgi:hypothetical protein
MMFLVVVVVAAVVVFIEPERGFVVNDKKCKPLSV